MDHEDKDILQGWQIKKLERVLIPNGRQMPISPELLNSAVLLSERKLNFCLKSLFFILPFSLAYAAKSNFNENILHGALFGFPHLKESE